MSTSTSFARASSNCKREGCPNLVPGPITTWRSLSKSRSPSRKKPRLAMEPSPSPSPSVSSTLADELRASLLKAQRNTSQSEGLKVFCQTAAAIVKEQVPECTLKPTLSHRASKVALREVAKAAFAIPPNQPK